MERHWSSDKAGSTVTTRHFPESGKFPCKCLSIRQIRVAKKPDAFWVMAVKWVPTEKQLALHKNSWNKLGSELFQNVAGNLRGLNWWASLEACKKKKNQGNLHFPHTIAWKQHLLLVFITTKSVKITVLSWSDPVIGNHSFRLDQNQYQHPDQESNSYFIFIILIAATWCLDEINVKQLILKKKKKEKQIPGKKEET